jgi:thiol-disulfide isomerase/thioredoxin
MKVTKVILLSVVVVFLLAMIGVIGKGSVQGFIGGFGDAGAPPVASFTMYYADWCPHCKTIKPEFADFSKRGVVTVNGKNVAVAMIEESDKEKMAGKNVKGFPTFLYETAAGETVEYSGPRTRDAWMDFLGKTV